MKRKSDLSLIVDDIYDDNKIIDVLYKHFNMSGRFVRALKKNRSVAVGGVCVSVYSRVNRGELLEIFFPRERCRDFPNGEIEINILYEDEWLMAIDKPSGILVHAIREGQVDTLSNGIANYMKSRGEDYLIRHVNRLDRDTSGVVLIAKNGYVHDQIAIQMGKGEVRKTYNAILKGILKEKERTLEFPIGKPDPKNIKREVMEDGKPAKTIYRVVSESEDLSLVEIDLITGRTHQIRVHMSYLGNPVLGDSLYGSEDELMERQALHARSYAFRHPINGKDIVIMSDLPEDISNLLKYKNFD